MDKEYLDKVLDKLVSETRIDYVRKVIETPFSPARFFLSFSFFFSFSFFTKHCKEVYGLTEKETQYVWEQYKNIIKDKINNE